MFAYLQDSLGMARGSKTDPEGREAVAYRLKCFRYGLGDGKVTQQTMTQRLGGTERGQTWGNWETGYRTPDDEEARKIEQTFGLPRPWIFYAREDLLSPHIRDIVRRGEARLEDEERAGGPRRGRKRHSSR